MFSENNKGIGVYLVYSAIFHILLIGLIIYLSIRYRPEIQSIGSKVVVSVVSSVPGHLASVKSILYPPKPKTVERPASKPVPVETAKPVSIPLTKAPSSMVYPKKRRYAPPHPYTSPHPYTPTLNSNVYAHLHNMVSLNNAYSKLNESLISGNVHRFQGYVNKIVSVITSNFNISLNKYLNYKSVVAFQISKSGRIYAVKLVKSSGNGYFDSQSVEAVKLSSPLPPPPAGFMRFVNSNNAGEGVLMNFNPREILKNRP
ncbi:MAG: TonB family protein [Deltaproteobacteria bacterium]|nr:TonB family protein [Deltaproteobacteria bacterium]